MTSLSPDAAVAGAREAGAWERLRRHPAGNIAIVLFTGLVLCSIVSLIYPDDFRFLIRPNIVVVLKSIPLLGFLALGVGILMIAGEFDISVASTFQLTSFLMVQQYTSGWPLALAVVLAIVVGLIIGLVNGLITTQLKIPSFITTLGTMFVIRGILLFVSQARPINFFPGQLFQDIFIGKLGIFRAQFLWLLLFALLAYLLLHRHRLGNHFFAVGGNREAAVAVGINVDRVKISAFMLSALGATIAGIIDTTDVQAVTQQTLAGLELQAIAVCVVGGLFLTGGRGNVIGIFLGACMVAVVRDVLFLARAPGFYMDMFFGAVIVIAVILNTLAAKR